MRTFFTIACVLSVAILASCDMRSGTAKDEMEKFTSSPTPTISPASVEAPVAPADIIAVDVNLKGDVISINGYEQNKTVTCTKFNRVTVNGGASKVEIKGACRQIMVNGDHHKITADAAMEFIINGSENTIKYSRFPNGKRPIVTNNGDDNVIEKTSSESVTGKQPQGKIVK